MRPLRQGRRSPLSSNRRKRESVPSRACPAAPSAFLPGLEDLHDLFHALGDDRVLVPAPATVRRRTQRRLRLLARLGTHRYADVQLSYFDGHGGLVVREATES